MSDPNYCPHNNTNNGPCGLCIIEREAAEVGSAPSIILDAFNIWPGATILKRNKVLIVMAVARDDLTEMVSIRSRRGDDTSDDTLYLAAYDYNDTVQVIGNVVNYADQYDNNWGAR